MGIKDVIRKVRAPFQEINDSIIEETFSNYAKLEDGKLKKEDFVHFYKLLIKKGNEKQ